MVTREVARKYREQRRPHISEQGLYGPVYAPASGALRFAKMCVWVEHNWNGFEGDTATSVDGQYRLTIKPDDTGYHEDDLFGDTYKAELHGNTVPGGKRTIEAQHKAAVARVERDGVWGYVLEKKCGACGNWEHIDSCWGFEGEVHTDAIIEAQFSIKA